MSHVLRSASVRVQWSETVTSGPWRLTLIRHHAGATGVRLQYPSLNLLNHPMSRGLQWLTHSVRLKYRKFHFRTTRHNRGVMLWRFCPFVCLSVRLSRAWVLTKRLNILQCLFYNCFCSSFELSHTKRRSEIAICLRQTVVMCQKTWGNAVLPSLVYSSRSFPIHSS